MAQSIRGMNVDNLGATRTNQASQLVRLLRPYSDDVLSVIQTKDPAVLRVNPTKLVP